MYPNWKAGADSVLTLHVGVEYWALSTCKWNTKHMQVECILNEKAGADSVLILLPERDSFCSVLTLHMQVKINQNFV